MAEREVQPEEAGLLPAELPDLRDTLVLGLLRRGEHRSFQKLPPLRLEPGDVIVYLVDETPGVRHAARHRP